MADMSKHVDKEYENQDFKELVDAPVDALAGVSKGDAELLKQAFNIKTIGDLGRNPHFMHAQAIVSQAESRR
jgi:hypothetical protein